MISQSFVLISSVFLKFHAAFFIFSAYVFMHSDEDETRWLTRLLLGAVCLIGAAIIEVLRGIRDTLETKR